MGVSRTRKLLRASSNETRKKMFGGVKRVPLKKQGKLTKKNAEEKHREAQKEGVAKARKKQQEKIRYGYTPLDYFKNVCEKNSVAAAAIEDLIKDKHALDNQHDFTAKRGDFVPNAKFIYFLNRLFNMSASDAKSAAGDLPNSYPPALGAEIPKEIFDRNTKLNARGIDFKDLEWDTFKYFSRKLPIEFSSTPDLGITFKEIKITDLIGMDGTLKGDNLGSIANEKHIIINASDLDPTKKFIGENYNKSLISLNTIYKVLLGLTEGDLYLNFDAKTKGIFTKPFEIDGRVNQLITYQNLYDSGNNMFSILSDAPGNPKTHLVKPEYALNEITSNYFSRNLTGRSYTMKYELYTPDLASKNGKEAFANIFDWVKIKVAQEGGIAGAAAAAGGAGAVGYDETILMTTNKQRNGPGVGVLYDYINKKIQGGQRSNLTEPVGYDTVHISQLLSKARSTSDVIKLCVDIKGGGDAEQVNAVWQFNRQNSTATCILVTGDILCYMYAITMGLPSVLIISNKIYLSKGIPKIPPSPYILAANRINNHMLTYSNFLKILQDITNTNGLLNKLMYSLDECNRHVGNFTFGEQILSDLQTKFQSIHIIYNIKRTITFLIKLKILDIKNYLIMIHASLQPFVDKILTITNTITKKYGETMEIYSKIFTIETFMREVTDIHRIEAKLKDIDSRMELIKTDLSRFEKILGNFKNKKYDATVTSFVSGITDINFYNGANNTTISSYSLFNYDRDQIYKLFAPILYKIMFLEPTAVKNMRAYLGKELRAAFQKYLESFFTFKMIDNSFGKGLFTDDIVIGYDKDVRNSKIYTELFEYLSIKYTRSISYNPDTEEYTFDSYIKDNKILNICESINEVICNLGTTIGLDCSDMKAYSLIIKPAAGAAAGFGAAGLAAAAPAVGLGAAGAASGLAAAAPPAGLGATGLGVAPPYSFIGKPGGAAAGHTNGGFNTKEMYGGSYDLNESTVKEFQSSILKILETIQDVCLSNDIIDLKFTIIDHPIESKEIHLTNEEVENVALEELRTCFKEIIQDAYYIIKGASEEEQYLEYMHESYYKLYDKWINEILNVEAIHAYDCKEYKNLVPSISEDITDSGNIIFIILKIFSDIHEKGELHGKTFKDIYTHVSTVFNKIIERYISHAGQTKTSKMRTGLNSVEPTFVHSAREKPTTAAFGGTRSYGEKSLTKMLKGMKLNKSKKKTRKQRKTLKKDRK